MRIAFIRPSMSGRASKDALQPLVFAVIKALTPSQVDLTFVDGTVEPVRLDLDVDAVALTVGTFTARTAYAIADAYRARGVPVVVGGFHPTACPDEAAEHADVVVVGEAEDTWPALLDDLAAGRPRSRYTSTTHADLAALRPDWSAVTGRHYPPLGLVQFGRGCRYACEFCSVHSFFGSTIRTRPVAHVIDEISSRPERYLFFVDDNLIADRAAATELLDALRPLGRRWACQASLDVADDPALLRRLRAAGCLMVLIGFESLDHANLQAMGKGANLRADYDRALAAIAEAGLLVYGTFVVGYDHDTAGTASELQAFADHHRFAVANFNPLMPMPGTRLYDRLEAGGRLRHNRWWLDPTYRYGDAMFTPTSMTPDELTAGCRRARFGFYSWPSILRRLPANARTPDHLSFYWLANVISRAEVHAKQGRALGVT